MRQFLYLASAVSAAALLSQSCLAREQIRMVGSSTVYPLAASVAEHFGRVGDFRTPVVESTGTGAGIKLFCEDVSEASPDITNASRPMLQSEREQCAKHEVRKITEVKIGYDGIALANSMKAPQFKLTRRDIFLALAREVPNDKGKWVANPYQRWQQVNAILPDLPIRVYGMPPVSGTRDTFVELVMEKGCLQLPQAAALEEKERKRRCRLIREDGAFIEAGENGNLIVQKLLGDEEALGILGFSFLDQNAGQIQASIIEGTAPEFDAIQNGSYAISRPLFMYIKGEHVGKVPGISQFIRELLAEGTLGDEGYLVAKGLIPLPLPEREHIRAEVFAATGAAKAP